MSTPPLLASPRGGTTPAGLPYPAPTDPVAEGAAAIQALAVAIDKRPRGRMIRSGAAGSIGNTAYTDLSPSAYWAAPGALQASPQPGDPTQPVPAEQQEPPPAEPGTQAAGDLIGIPAYANGWTLPISGLWRISYEARCSGNAVLFGVAINYTSGSPLLQLSATAAPVQNIASATVQGVLRCSAGSTVKLFGLTASAVSQWVATAGFFAVEWVGD